MMPLTEALLRSLNDELSIARSLLDQGEMKAAALAFRSVSQYAAFMATVLGKGDSGAETEGSPDCAQESGDRGREGALPGLREADG